MPKGTITMSEHTDDGRWVAACKDAATADMTANANVQYTIATTNIHGLLWDCRDFKGIGKHDNLSGKISKVEEVW